MITWEQVKSTVKDGHITWEELLDDRQVLELQLAQVYERDYHHGTTGHNQLMLIAKLSQILDAIRSGITIEGD